MTAITLTESDKAPTPGLKKGAWSAQSGYTSSFGLKNMRGVILLVDDDDDLIVTCAISSGVGTIKFVNDEGSEVAGATKTGYYLAWGE